MNAQIEKSQITYCRTEETEGRIYRLLKLDLQENSYYALQIKNEETDDLAVLGTVPEQAEAWFRRAVAGALHPIHLQDFARDCLLEAEFFC